MNADPRQDRQRRASFWLLVAITVILAGWALRATSTFMVPVVFSVFLAVLVAPLDRMIKERVPERIGWLGHVAAVSTILVAQLVVVGMVWLAAEQVFERFPVADASGGLLSRMDIDLGGDSDERSGDVAADGAEAETGAEVAEGNPSAPGAEVSEDGEGGEGGEGRGENEGGAGGAASEGSEGSESSKSAVSASGTSGPEGLITRFRTIFSGLSSTLIGTLGEWASGMAVQFSRAAGTLVGAVVLVFFLTLIMLIEGPKWRQKIATALAPAASEKVMDSLAIIADRLRRYLVARTILGVITTALYITWLWIFDVDLLVVWALITFLLNYIPTLGSLISGALPVIYAFTQKDFGTAMAIGAGIFAIEQIMGNYIDPRVQGRQVSLSSLVILIALLIWGWVWGVAGAVLAVPITIATMIVCAHIRPLRPFALMLSNASDMDELDRQARGADR